jgi:hypothetical protein
MDDWAGKTKYEATSFQHDFESFDERKYIYEIRRVSGLMKPICRRRNISFEIFRTSLISSSILVGCDGTYVSVFNVFCLSSTQSAVLRCFILTV